MFWRVQNIPQYTCTTLTPPDLNKTHHSTHSKPRQHNTTHHVRASGHCQWRPVLLCTPGGKWWRGPLHTAATHDTPAHHPHAHTDAALQHTRTCNKGKIQYSKDGWLRKSMLSAFITFFIKSEWKYANLIYKKVKWHKSHQPITEAVITQGKISQCNITGARDQAHMLLTRRRSSIPTSGSADMLPCLLVSSVRVQSPAPAVVHYNIKPPILKFLVCIISTYRKKKGNSILTCLSKAV